VSFLFGGTVSMRRSSMRSLLFAVAVMMVCHQTAAAYWPTTGVTRGTAERDRLPLAVAVHSLGDGTVRVEYEVTRAGPFAHLRAAEVLAADGDKLLLQAPIPVPAAGPGAEPGPVKGTLRVSLELLGKCRLRLDCPVEPLSESGQTYSIALASYLK
jgi:hypothetical protein